MTKRCGTKRNAARALAGDLQMVGEGVNRIVYTDGKYVYKVQWNDSTEEGTSGCRDSNAKEWKRAQRARRSGSALAEHIAPTTMWRINGVPVLAQPHYSTLWRDLIDEDGDDPDFEDVVYRVADRFGIPDTHDENVAVVNGEPILFDLVGWN